MTELHATTSIDDEDYSFLCQDSDVTHFEENVAPAFYYVVFTVSVLGNGLILFLLLKFENVRTVTNFFILNLVISDLLFAISLPFWGHYHNHEWIFGKSLCKAVSSVFYIGFYSSISFLTMMTVDRYVAVVHPVQATRTRRLSYVYVASALIWVLSLIATIPKFVLYGTRNGSFGGMVCEETGYEAEQIKWWKKAGYYQQLMVYFLLPLVVILYCYSMIVFKLLHAQVPNKDKAMKLILLIVVAFFICWTPYNVVIFIKAKNYEECNGSLDYTFYVCRNIAYFHCCVNPFFYTLVGTKFRHHLASEFGNWRRWGSRYSPSSLSSRVSTMSPQTVRE